MSAPEDHFLETKKLVLQLDKFDVADWLLNKGYYPEQYVLPPCFNVNDFNLEENPIFKIEVKNRQHRLNPPVSQLETISLPSTILTVRDFSIIDPRHYHDLVFHICEDWEFVINHIFHDDNKIYIYSFPIPISRQEPGKIGPLRSGRMIYEFLEMAERDLVAEAHRFEYILKTDVSNCYASIYTHSIAWALYGKKESRKDRFSIDSLGKKIDKLIQRSNDGCTNGIAVGPAISDLIAEMLLAAVDRKCSKMLRERNIVFLGVRFKDDYRFLCKSEHDARRIMSILQQCMNIYNLGLSEDKSETQKLPEGIFRKWRSAYNPLSLRYKGSIPYNLFESTFRSVLDIDSKYPGTGIIDAFLSELTSKKDKLKLTLSEKNRIRTFSLLMLLKDRRPKSFPMILGVLESMLSKYSDDEKLKDHVTNSLLNLLNEKNQRPYQNQYEVIWLYYFIKIVLQQSIRLDVNKSDPFISSLINGRREFFNEFSQASFFLIPKLPIYRNHLLDHMSVFRAKKREDEAESK